MARENPGVFKNDFRRTLVYLSVDFARGIPSPLWTPLVSRRQHNRKIWRVCWRGEPEVTYSTDLRNCECMFTEHCFKMQPSKQRSRCAEHDRSNRDDTNCSQQSYCAIHFSIISQSQRSRRSRLRHYASVWISTGCRWRENRYCQEDYWPICEEIHSPSA